MSTLLLTRPNHDIFTRILHHWSKPLIELAAQKGLNVIDLPRGKATRGQVQGRIAKLSPDLIVLNGHGSANVIAGDDDKALVDERNAAILANSITYCLSCSTAAVLGPLAVSKGARAYIGYSREFWVVSDSTKSTNPLQDSIAAQFMEPANAVSTSLLKGHTVEESHNISQEAHRCNIKRLMSSAADNESAQYVRFLIWNMKSQNYSGDGRAKVA